MSIHQVKPEHEAAYQEMVELIKRYAIRAADSSRYKWITVNPQTELVAEGLIELVEIDQTLSGPRYKYRLTARGREEWKREQREMIIDAVLKWGS